MESNATKIQDSARTNNSLKLSDIDFSEADKSLQIIQSRPESPEMLLSFVPPIEEGRAEFCSTAIAHVGNICTIVAQPGHGKSQVIEAGITSAINPNVDTHNLKLLLDGGPGLWLDGERTMSDIFKGMQRIRRRSGSDEFIENDRFKNIHCHSLISLPSPSGRIKELSKLIEVYKPSIVLLDGAGDFIADINDASEVTDFIGFLIASANTHSFAVITTIHPNPGATGDTKPRGVLGSELLRKSESVLLLKRAPEDKNIRILTTDYAHGKNRNGSDSLETYFRWDDEAMMFVTCDYTPAGKSNKTDEQQNAFEIILADGGKGYGALCASIVALGKSEPTAKRWIKQASEKGLITNINGMYRYHQF